MTGGGQKVFKEGKKKIPQVVPFLPPSDVFRWVRAWGAVMCQVLPCQKHRAARKAVSSGFGK